MKSNWSHCRTVRNPRGQEILLKEYAPDARPGTFDPLVLARYMGGPDVAQSMFGVGMPLAQKREAMQWFNQDLTGGAVLRQELKAFGVNGETGMYLYRPVQEKIRPCLLYFHGGGFFAGSCRTVENNCKYLALAADAVVLSVDYRLAPEDPYPAGLDDCFDAVNWAWMHAGGLGIDPARLGVCGDSAGGTLAAACALRDRDLGLNRIRFQGLLYPAVNLAALEHSAYRWDESEYELAPEQARWVKSAVYALAPGDKCVDSYYIGDRRDLMRHPYVSPLFAASFEGLPAALVVTPEFDYLRLEAEAYGRLLSRAGVPVQMIRYQGMDHAFFDKLGDYAQAEDCILEVAAAFLRAVER